MHVVTQQSLLPFQIIFIIFIVPLVIEVYESIPKQAENGL